MKWTLFALAVMLVASTIMIHDPATGQEEQEDPVSVTMVDDVTAELENRSGKLHLLLEVTGRAPPGTDNVNISLGFEDSTERTDIGMWLDPLNFDLFFVGIYLKPVGPSNDPWTEWEFKVWADIELDSIFSTLELIAPLLGIEGLEGIGDLDGLEDIGDIEGIEGMGDLSNLTDLWDGEELLDQETIMETLMDSSLLFLARGHDGGGNFTEGEKDIKWDLMNAVFEYLISEGMMEDPLITDDDDDDTEEVDENKDDEGDSTVGLVALVAVISGIILLLLVLVIILLMATRNSDR